MGHHIRAFVASFNALHDAATSLPGARVVPLRGGFGLLPITDRISGGDEPIPYPELDQLTAHLADWAVDQSHWVQLAYIETEYFGGDGTQAAVGWQNGRVVIGPLKTADGLGPGRSRTPLSDGAINQVLRTLGVPRGAARDEFDALGLGRFRSNDQWMAEGGIT